MNKYQNGKVYKIVSQNTEKVYVGSTCKDLIERLGEHKRKYDGYVKKLHCTFYTSFLVLEKGNYTIELLENVPCDSKIVLLMAEQRYINSIPECCNLLNCILTDNERRDKMYKLNRKYREAHREELSEKSKEYYYKNKDNVLKRVKTYHEQNKEHRNNYSHEYYQKNKEKMNDYFVTYREENREIINERAKAYFDKNKFKVVCECGREVTKNALGHHKKTKVHLEYLNNIKQI
jgi:hypothetical protein